MRTRIKICCISSHEEASLATDMGADALGLVGPMPSGPCVINDDLIKSIAQRVSPPTASFLLTSEQTATAIIEQVKKAGVNTVQLVDEINKHDFKRIRESLPFLKIVQVIHVTGDEKIDEALAIESEVDAFLLDSGNPKAKLKILGGTGKTHNWEISRELVRRTSRPVFLAGGLHPGNVAEAISVVKPFGVDICSGVRSQGVLDREKLREFILAVRFADGVSG